MRSAKPSIDVSRKPPWNARIGSGLLLLVVWITGCSNVTTNSQTNSTTSTTAHPQAYFGPTVAGATYAQFTDPGIPIANEVLTSPLSYTIDDVAGTFSDTTYQPKTQPGPQVLNAGNFTIAQRGLRSLGITANYVYNTNVLPTVYYARTYNPPQAGSFAVELANQAGALAQLYGQPATPLVAAAACPDFKSAQAYQFITIPGALGSSNSNYEWNPATDTAYGSVQISASGTTVTLQNIQQFTLPSVGGPGAPAQPPASSATGACGSTFFGNTTVVPAQLVITTPGAGGQRPPQATMGIGPTGLLVEDNGAGTGQLPNTSPSLGYNNVLGAGTGAIGLPAPSSALDTGAVAAAQYLGFIYGAGIYSTEFTPPSGWSSHVASFGFPSAPPSCASVAASTGTMIYGGDFPNDDPSTSSDGFGNCDVAIDLGAQSSSNNGLYPQATVWMGAGYAGNTSGQTYSFSAVAIVGQLNGKYAIFVLGVDSAQPWAIDLLQSN